MSPHKNDAGKPVVRSLNVESNLRLVDEMC